MTLADAITDLDGAKPLLPLTHVTTVADFEMILKGNRISASSRCPRFKRPSAYFFYGAPFYKVPQRLPTEQDLDDVDQHVIGLLLPPNTLLGIGAEIYPFDTGALLEGLYEPIMQMPDGLDDYFIDSTQSAEDASKLVELFFGTNASYIFGDRNAKCTASVSVTDSVKKVAELHRAKLRADIRRRAVEVVTLTDVGLPSDTMVLVAPENYLKHRSKKVPVLGQLLDEGKLVPLTYNNIYPFNPVSDSRVVLELAVDWLKKNSYLG